jgi:alkanesulfonate monooxygenase SsuD/methylene tetrahydromethanopterin reductase-like flavin-dependent oxidoreductase (luciferase family)
VHFEGRFFKVRGPLITPRPPQGQPLVVIDAVSPPAVALAGRRADIALIAAADVDSAGQLREELRALAVAAGRPADSLSVLAVADVVFGPDSAQAAAERRVLDSLVTPDPADDRLAGALDYVGAPVGFAGLAAGWFRAEAVDGFVLRPALLALGLDQVVDAVVPSLRASGVFRSAYTKRSLRHRFGLEHPPNRYATAESVEPVGSVGAAEAVR